MIQTLYQDLKSVSTQAHSLKVDSEIKYCEQHCFQSHKTHSNIRNSELFVMDNIAMHLGFTPNCVRHIKIKYCICM